MGVLGYTVLTLCALGVVLATLLYIVAQKFKVHEDPRIDDVEKMLPGANCGGCGLAGCRALAEALVNDDGTASLYCPVAGNEDMKLIADILGRAAVERAPQVAVVRCNGTCENSPKLNKYDGAKSCAVVSGLYAGETGCFFGCIGLGDCVVSCNFDAIKVNLETGLPEVDKEKCTACGACVTACPKVIMELRRKMPKNREIYVSCVNKERGAVARKSCAVACIACGKCVKVCPFDAITLEDNLAYIDSDKCKLCRKCVKECPTNAIIEVGFPERSVVIEEEYTNKDTQQI